MSVNAIPHPLKPDRPLTEAANDALGIARSAQTIAQSILTMDANNGFVIGIYGEWGLGKTTYMNFVKEELQKAEKGQKPIIVDFNPWLFSNHTDLIQQFFVELSKEFPRNKFLEWGEAKKALLTADTILTYAVTAAATAKLGPVVGGAVHTVTKKTVSYFRNKPSLSKQKKQISEKLRELNRKIIVFIDDIDRLDPDDMLNIFKLVKSVADFPNIIYILGLDRNNTCALLEGKHSGLKGHEYLDKIVQYPIDLPHPGENRLNKLLGNFINATLDEPGGKAFDRDRWHNFFGSYLSKKLNTPRAVMRLSSAFNLHYIRLRGDVDPVDFLAIESIRLLDPAFFPEIQRHQDLFLGTDFAAIVNKETPSKIYIDEKIKNNKTLRYGLNIIFPNFERERSSISYAQEKHLICSKKYFDRYFSHVIDDHEFTKQQIIGALAVTGDVEKFKEILDSYKNQKLNIVHETETKLNYFFSKLRDIIKDEDIKKYYKDICNLLLKIGDHYLDGSINLARPIGYTSTQYSIMNIIDYILKEIYKENDQYAVYELLKIGFTDSESIYTDLRTLDDFSRAHDLYGLTEKSIDDESSKIYLLEDKVVYLRGILFNNLKNILSSPIEERDGRIHHKILDHPESGSIIFNFLKMQNNDLDDLKDFLNKILKNEKLGCLAFLMAIKSTGYSGNTGKFYCIDRETIHKYSKDGLINIINLRSFANYLLEQTMNLHEKIIDPPLSKDEKQVLESFLEVADEFVRHSQTE